MGVRSVSFLTDSQLDLVMRGLQLFLPDHNISFWSMQGSVSADELDWYRLELPVALTEEEGDRIVHQLAGLHNRAESPPESEYWESDGELDPE